MVVLRYLVVASWLLRSVEGNFLSRLINLKPAQEEEARPAVLPEGLVAVEDGVAMAVLPNNTFVPLVGYGVGNMQSDLIPDMVAAAIQEGTKTRMIETSHVSGNERQVAEGIVKGAEMMNLNDNEKLEVHVVTKVWYTHLGYERTKLSVMESLEALKPALDSDKVDLRVHFLIHWPRCFDSIEWMDCARDEANLPQYVKDAGPSPNNDDQAWKQSWKMLEDLYLSQEYPVESIGVANFHLHDLEQMDSFMRVRPRILQLNLWSLLYDSELVQYCHEKNIHIQVFHVMRSTLANPERAPLAFHHIQQIAYELSNRYDMTVTPTQVMLAWLVQHGISVVPRTSKMSRLALNSGSAITRVPGLTDYQVETVAHAVEAYLSGEDLQQDIRVTVTFTATTKDVLIYWLSPQDEIRIAHVLKGQLFNETTYPNHKYRIYDAQNKDRFIEYTVQASFGYHEDVHVDLQDMQAIPIRHEPEKIGAGPEGGIEQGGAASWFSGMLHSAKN